MTGDDNAVHEIAKAIENEFKVPYEFTAKLLAIEARSMHHPKRTGIVKKILEMLVADYWTGVDQ